MFNTHTKADIVMKAAGIFSDGLKVVDAAHRWRGTPEKCTNPEIWRQKRQKDKTNKNGSHVIRHLSLLAF